MRLRIFLAVLVFAVCGSWTQITSEKNTRQFSIRDSRELFSNTMAARPMSFGGARKPRSTYTHWLIAPSRGLSRKVIAATLLATTPIIPAQRMDPMVNSRGIAETEPGGAAMARLSLSPEMIGAVLSMEPNPSAEGPHRPIASFSRSTPDKQIDEVLTKLARAATPRRLRMEVSVAEQQLGRERFQEAFVRLQAQHAPESLLTCMLELQLSFKESQATPAFIKAVIATALSQKYGNKDDWEPDSFGFKLTYLRPLLPPNLIAIRLLPNYSAVDILKQILGRKPTASSKPLNYLDESLIRVADASLRRNQSEPFSESRVDQSIAQLKNDDDAQKATAIEYLATALDNSAGRPYEIEYLETTFSKNLARLLETLDKALLTSDRHELAAALFLRSRIDPLHLTDQLVYKSVLNYKPNRSELANRTDLHWFRAAFIVVGYEYAYESQSDASKALVSLLNHFISSPELWEDKGLVLLMNIFQTRLPGPAAKKALASFVKATILKDPLLADQALKALANSALGPDEYQLILAAKKEFESRSGKKGAKAALKSKSGEKDTEMYGVVLGRLKDSLKNYKAPRNNKSKILLTTA